MAIVEFPRIECADEHGLLAVGGDLDVESLLLAYTQGIFPWPVFGDGTLAWFSPPERALLFLDSVRVPKSLKKRAVKGDYEIRVNTAFQQVLGGCAAIINRGSQRDTWITDEVREGYFELHKAGFCHSVECWENNELSGGLYGVAIGGMFAGESMFFRRAEASKLCLLFLIEYLHKNDVPWIDCQQLTPLLERFGAVQVPRERFLGLLKTAINREITLFREFS